MTDADGMRVSGIIDAVTDVVSVSVNGIPAESLDGAFSRWRTTADVPLAPGKNTLRVTATRSAGPALTLSGTVWRKPASTVGQLVPANLISFATVMSLFQQLQATGIAWDRTSRSWLISYEGQGSGLVAIDDSGAWIEPPAATPPPPLRACTGAMVDPASRPCRVAEGTFDGGAIVLVQLPDAGGDVASTERWQVRFFEPATETLSTWFDITVSGTLTSAAVDADGARLAVGIAGPFALEVYDLPGGAGPGSLMFGSGPMTDLFRAEAYDTAVMQDGHLLVQRGLFSVDPSTGIRRPVSPPTLGGFGPARLYPDPLTGEFIAVTAGGTFRLARDFSSSTRLGDSLGGVPASDFANRKMYAVGDGVINVLDVGTGALQSIPAASDSLQSVVACMVGLASASSHQGVLYLEAFANVPGPPPINSTCGCFKYDLVSGEVDPFVCTPQETRDGRLLSAGAGVSIVDPETGTETPFSRAPDHGRGFPIPVGIRSSLAVDPRRDRIWVSNVNSDISPEPQRYFVIDPFNGDRALVSD
jgi:hypothetical protein